MAKLVGEAPQAMGWSREGLAGVVGEAAGGGAVSKVATEVEDSRGPRVTWKVCGLDPKGDGVTGGFQGSQICVLERSLPYGLAVYQSGLLLFS